MRFFSRVFTSALLALAVIAPVSGTSTNLALTTAGGIATHACDYEKDIGAGNNRTVPKGIDGFSSGDHRNNMVHTCIQDNTWWEVSLAANVAIETIKIYNRAHYLFKLKNTKVQIFDETGNVSEIDLIVGKVWNQNKLLWTSILNWASLKLLASV